ncbi:divergent polysaccharide deacetylase family protein [Desulfobacterales bacterium HSG16]|nr:divergent polysaccharide deacetylase family protein [Desulfobacterales bacterium HSG16]
MMAAGGLSARRNLAPAFGSSEKIQPQYEIFPSETIRSPRLFPRFSTKTPRIAIIIDDVGYNKSVANALLNLNANLTFSVLPHSPFHKEFLKKAKERGAEIMLHLPMEPVEYPRINPGPGALLTSMSPKQILAQLKDNLASVPFAKGVNNHMGSKMTTISSHMYPIFQYLKSQDLFFIDSYTTPDSCCGFPARTIKIPFARRDIFIDHFRTSEFIHKQIDQLIKIAEHQGEALGIGHPYPETLKALKKALPYIREKVKIVPASQVVHTIG